MTSSRENIDYTSGSPVNKKNSAQSFTQYILFILLFIALVATVIVLVLQVNEISALKNENVMLQATIQALQQHIISTPQP